MPGATTPITDREKAAILALKMGIFPDTHVAYIAAEDKPRKEVNTKGIKSQVSRWINSPKFKQYAEYVDRLLADREADARRRERERIEAGTNEEGDGRKIVNAPKRTQEAKVDYYDPANQRKQINRIIEESSDDPKTQLDAIKAIQQTQRDDRQAAKDSQIQRFYSPIQCRDCVIKANFAKLRRRLQAQEAQPDEDNTTI